MASPDPECTSACQAEAHARGDCPEPATSLAHFGPLLAMRARLRFMNESAPSLASSTTAISGIKHDCIAVAQTMLERANRDVVDSLNDLNALVAAAGGS